MRNRSCLIPALALALTLLVTALLVTPAFAQDETPTEVPTETAGTETEPTPEAGVPPIEEAPVEVPTEIPAASAGSEVPVPVETPVETPAAALADTGLTLLDGSGEPLVMASEEAAGALAAGDVWFKVGTTTYIFNEADCDPDPGNILACTTPIQAAIDYIQINAKIPSDGSIHVDGPITFNDQVITINGSDANVNKIKALYGHVSTTTLKPDVNLGYIAGIGSSLHILNMNSGAGFTLSGFNIDSHDNSVGGAGGLSVEGSTGPLRLIDLEISNAVAGAVFIGTHTGNIELTRVDFSDSSGSSLYLYTPDNTGSVIINNSSFDNSGGDSFNNNLTIVNKGNVTLQGVTVNNNDYGLLVKGGSNVTIKNSVINGNSGTGSNAVRLGEESEPLYGTISLDNVVINNNGAGGLEIHTLGNITANKLLIKDNTSFGGRFDTCGNNLSDCNYLGTGKVTITNSNFDENNTSANPLSDLLRIWSRGAVVLTNVSASGNTAGAGAQVHTHNSLLVVPVTIAGGTFNDNATYGLEVLAKGTITLSKVQAGGNLGGYGAKLDNSSGTTAGVVIKGTALGDNAFDGNNNSGLFIRSNGAVTLGYLSASGNAGRGLDLDSTTTGVVTINKGTFDGNALEGMVVKSKGAIKFTTLSASNNMNQGANLDNTTGTAGVTITGGDFSRNQGMGLYVRSKGAITLKTTQAYGNSVQEMDFPAGVYTVHDVFGVNGSDDIWMVEVDSGMFAIPYDAILSSAHANGVLEIRDPFGNLHESATAVSSGDLYVASILDFIFDATGTWTFSVRDNSTYLPVGYFLSSDVFGATTGDEWFGYYGADLDNTSGTAGVTIANAAFPKYEWGEIIPERDFNSNNAMGLRIRTNGAVAVTSVVAYGNGSFGVNIDNSTSLGTPNVTFTNGRFIANGDTGLEVLTKGGITAKNIGSAWNADIGNAAVGKGAHLVTTIAGKVVSVINNNSTADNYIPGFENNMANGLEISSQGAVTLTNVRAFENEMGDGISVVTSGGSGNITLTNVRSTYSRNGYGILIDNHQGAGNVIINGGYAADNELDGIHIETHGSITLNKVYAEYNRGQGAFLDNSNATTYAPVTITNMPLAGNIEYLGFSANDFGGLEIRSRGLVTLTNVIAGWNTGNGATIENNNGPYDVKINSSIFNENMDDGVIGGYGLKVTSMGSIILNKGSASGNFLRGAHLDNDLGGDSPIKAVTITNFVFDNNGATGLGIASNGVVTLTNVSASGNAYYGAYIRNGASNVFVKSSGSGSNTFSDNGYSGLDIRTSGTVSLAKVNAIGNTGGYGAQIGADAARTSNVTVLSSAFDQNSMSGLLVYSLGTVSLNGVSAFDNASLGAYILNETATTATNVSIIKSTFTENNASGLAVRSKGVVTLNGITILNNGTGADINNTYGTAGVSVLSTLGANTFNGNSSRGLYIRSNGNIILSNVTASNNGNHGIDIDNYQIDTGFGYVMMTKVTTWSNTYRGINILTKGVVTMDGISSVMNGAGGYSGILMNTYGHNFSIKNSLVTSNGAYGIHATLGIGTFTITNTFYFGNSTAGSVENILID